MKRYWLIPLFVLGVAFSALAQQNCQGGDFFFPCTVGTVTLTAQSQNIEATPIFTPAESGVFRITVYLTVAPYNGHKGTWVVNVGWIDDEHARTETLLAINYVDTFASATYIARDVAGQPILYQAKFNGLKAYESTCDLFITVEQIQ